MNKKNIFLWTLYDFANSIVEVVFFLYCAQWLVIDKGVSDFWFNMIFVGGTILLIFTAPIFGILSDRRGVQMPYLRGITWLTFLSFLGSAIVMLFLSNKVVLAAIFFLLVNYFYQFSFTFYNALLAKIAPPERQGFVSGIGQAGNWTGQIVGLLISIPFATGAVYLFGEHGRAQTLLPVTILFLLFALPLMYGFKERSVPIENVHWNFWEELSLSFKKFKKFCTYPSMGAFLLGYFFFNDAILTAQNNFPIYIDRIFHINDTTKSLLLIGILCTSAVGALVSGWATKKLGLRKTLLIVLGSWAIILPALAVMTSFTVFVAGCVLVGLLFGAVWTVTRVVMVRLTPEHEMNYGMSYYTLAERFATFVGPLSWGLITSLLVPTGEIRYRIALAVMGVFVLIGLLFVKKIKFDHDKS